MAKRVLVADDSATIQRAFSMVFGGLQDSISVVPARNFDEAMSLARQGRPDLVITDIALGNRSGYDLCAALKSDPGMRGMPVLILGSGQTPYDEVKGRQAGADGHLMKPFESQSLIDRVHEALARPAVAASQRPESTAPPPVASARPAGARPAPVAIDLDDEYGEFTIERPSAPAPAPRGATAAPVLATAPPPTPAASRPPATPPLPTSPFAPASGKMGSSAPAAGTGSGAPLRPSLIPGARPPPAGRPSVSLHPAGGGVAPVSASASAAPPTAAAQRPSPLPSFPKRTDPAPSEVGSGAPTAQVNMGRTIMGLPAVAIPASPPAAREARVEARAEARPQSRPVAPVAAPTVAPLLVPASTPGTVPASAPAVAPTVVPAAPTGRNPIAPVRPPASPGSFPLAPFSAADSAAVVSARIDQKVAAIAARGPEYEAVAKLSREIIEQVVWEVVPELAELIIREHVERLANARK